jgi:hypothetical protein
VIDLRSWPKQWNDASRRHIAKWSEHSPSRPWPLLGMFVLGLAVGAALGGLVVSQRSQMKRLVRYPSRMGDEPAEIDRAEAGAPSATVSSTRSNHRRKTASEV